MPEINPVRATEPDVAETIIRIQGAGAANPTKERGHGVTVTRLGVGNYRFTWAENPGTFLGFEEPGKQATASGALKQTTTDAIAYDATNRRLDIQHWSSAGAARELAAAEWLTFRVLFKRTSVG
jgi:hypothetical protein